jgi:hypothetical protein
MDIAESDRKCQIASNLRWGYCWQVQSPSPVNSAPDQKEARAHRRTVRAAHVHSDCG